MTQTIEQLQARVRELEWENVKLKAESRDACLGLNDYYGRKLAAEQEENGRLENQVLARDTELWGRTQEILGLKEQLAAEQLNNKRLRDALIATRDDLELRMRLTEDDSLNISNSVLDQMLDAIDIPASTEALDEYVADKVKESHKVIPREGLVPHAYQLEATHNNAEYWYKLGHSEEMAAKGESVICMAQAVFAWRNAAYSKVKEVATITKQRDLAVEALHYCVKQVPELATVPGIATAIKESEAK